MKLFGLRSAPPGPALRCALLVALLVALGGAAEPARADQPPEAVAESETPADRAFRRLASPVQDERRQAVKTLVSLLPGVRERVITALPKASWTVQMHLLEVLSRDGGEEALRALLGHLVRTDETQAVQIRMSLVRDARAAGRLLEAYRKDAEGFFGAAAGSAKGILRLKDLVMLLRRAEIEQKFISRKSKSGSTGYYRGQYNNLMGEKLGPHYREQALEVVTGIALDEAVRTPGVYKSGVYRFLRPHHIEEYELRGMAINAVAEICTPDDVEIIGRLRDHLFEMDRKRERMRRNIRNLIANGGDWQSKAFDDARVDWEDALGEYADVVACLTIILPDEYNELVSDFVDMLRHARYPYVPRFRYGYIAGILIRVGRYPEAIEAYQDYMDRGGGSKPLSYYNLACAWSSFAAAEGATKGQREMRKDMALLNLRKSVVAGWSDVSWMDEDRDLDAIRDTADYRQLVKIIERKLELPPDDEK